MSWPSTPWRVSSTPPPPPAVRPRPPLPLADGREVRDEAGARPAELRQGRLPQPPQHLRVGLLRRQVGQLLRIRLQVVQLFGNPLLQIANVLILPLADGDVPRHAVVLGLAAL